MTSDMADLRNVPTKAQAGWTAPKFDSVLIVVPTFNEAEHIQSLLSFLAGEARRLTGRVTIVVADGRSTDATRTIVEAVIARANPRAAHRLVLLSNPLRIQSAGINLAVERHGAGHEFLVRVDAHGLYPSGFIAALVEEGRSRDAASVVVSMDTQGTSFFGHAAAAAQNSILGNGGSSHRRASAGRFVDHGHHALMRIEAFRAVGGYDRTFSHNEDAELDIRLKRSGYRIWLTDQVRMIYFPRRTPAALFRQYFGYGIGRARNSLKHQTVPSLRQVAPLLVAPSVALSALGVLFPVFVLPTLLWIGICLTVGIALGVRERRFSSALAGIAAMIMHLGWSLGFWRTLLVRA